MNPVAAESVRRFRDPFRLGIGILLWLAAHYTVIQGGYVLAFSSESRIFVATFLVAISLAAAFVWQFAVHPFAELGESQVTVTNALWTYLTPVRAIVNIDEGEFLNLELADGSFITVAALQSNRIAEVMPRYAQKRFVRSLRVSMVQPQVETASTGMSMSKTRTPLSRFAAVVLLIDLGISATYLLLSST